MALTFIPVTPASRAAPAELIDSITPETRAEIEEAASYFLADTYDGVSALSVTFPDEAAKLKWVSQVRVYCAGRPEGVKLSFRTSPVRNAPDNSLTFRIRTLAAAEKSAADAKASRDAAAKK